MQPFKWLCEPNKEIYWRRKAKGYKSTLSRLKYLLDINRDWEYDTKPRHKGYQ